jgi:hypothetical protein
MEAKTIPHMSLSIDTHTHERVITSVLEQDTPTDDVEILVAGDAPMARTSDNISLYRWDWING